MPDSNVQVANSFGKLVLKSIGDKNGGSDLDDDLDDHMTINGDDPDPFNEFAILSSNKAFANNANNFLEATSLNSTQERAARFRPAILDSKWATDSDNLLVPAEKRSFSLDQPASCMASGSTSTSDRTSWLNSNLNQYLDRKSPDLGQFKVIKADEGTKSETQSNSGFSDTYEEAFRRRTPQTKPKNNHESVVNKAEDTHSEEELSQMVTSKPFVPGKILFQQPAHQTTLPSSNGPLKANYFANSTKAPHKSNNVSGSNSSSDTDASNTHSTTPPSPLSSSSSSSPSNQQQAPTSFKKQILKHQTQVLGKEKITNF